MVILVGNRPIVVVCKWLNDALTMGIMTGCVWWGRVMVRVGVRFGVRVRVKVAMMNDVVMCVWVLIVG